MDPTDEPVDARTAVGNFVFAADWAAARDVVAADPWYLSAAAASEMASLFKEAFAAAGDQPGAAPQLALFDVARGCLEAARELGVERAFAELAARDQWLQTLLYDAPTPAALIEALGRGPRLAKEAVVGGLLQLAIRASAREEAERARRFFAMAEVARDWDGAPGAGHADETDEAELARRIAAVCSIAPQRAMAADIAAADAVLEALAGEVGSPRWIAVQGRLGSFLLESPEGDRAENIERAEHAYRSILDATPPECSEAREIGVSGLANALAREPTSSKRIEEARSLYLGLLNVLREADDRMRLALVTSQYAGLLARLKTGDVDSALEEAIDRQREVVALLEDENGRPVDALLWGRAQHNLGSFYARRRTGVASQNVDLAVRVLHAALTVRTPEADPVGRARTLGGLAALYADWTGADSPDHGQALAEAAAQEATAIEAGDPAAAARARGRAALERERSALSEDLSEILDPAAPDLMHLIQALIERHREAVAVVSREGEPALWAEWVGGLGRLIGRAHVFGIDELFEQAAGHFEAAIGALAGLDRPRLRRDLLARLAELAHESGRWEEALEAAGSAVEVGFAAFDELATRESRLRELEDLRALPLVASYAAFRLGRLDDAVAFAEAQRARSFADLAVAAELLPRLGPEDRAAVRELVARVDRLQTSLDALVAATPEGQASGAFRRLADGLGMMPARAHMRITAASDDGEPENRAQQAELRAALSDARSALRTALVGADGESGPAGVNLSADDVRAVAAEAGCPLVYVLSSAHGGVALIVAPGGEIETVALATLTSDRVYAHVLGDAGTAGLSARGDLRALVSTLDRSLTWLADALGPLRERLTGQDRARAILVPVGRLALLPLHAVLGARALCSYAPSAAVLAAGLAVRRAKPVQERALLIGAPTRADVKPLPYAAVESLAIAATMAEESAQAIVGEDAGAGALRSAPTATVLHFACHGLFRPSEPLASSLLLAGEDRLTVADVMSGTPDLSAARLVCFSACQTGNVEFYRNPDEALGFPSALLLAGVPAVVTTLWPVHDVAAMLFFVRFYDRVFAGGETPAAALVSARDWLRAATAAELVAELKRIQNLIRDRNPDDILLSRLWRHYARAAADSLPFAAPVHWAAFVLAGT